MKTKLVYVLTCTGNDKYAAMVVLSLYTFKIHNPTSNAFVVMDESTHLALEKDRSSILDNATSVVVDIPPEYNVMQRSRYLKTNLRRIVEGDFLYIDSDTFVTGSLDDVDDTDADVAMVTDLNRPLEQGNTNDDIERSIRAGFCDLENEPYFNGGVMFARDTPVAHKLFDKWHECWKKSLANGVPQDQPALCEANRVLEHPIKKLSGIWNCQYRYLNNVDYGKFLKNVKILHYYAVVDFGFLLTFLIERTRKKGEVDAVVATIVRHPILLVRFHQVSMLRWKLKRRLGKA